MREGAGAGAGAGGDSVSLSWHACYACQPRHATLLHRLKGMPGTSRVRLLGVWAIRPRPSSSLPSTTTTTTSAISFKRLSDEPVMAERAGCDGGSSRRRRDRQLRTWHRHVKMTAPFGAPHEPLAPASGNGGGEEGEGEVLVCRARHSHEVLALQPTDEEKEEEEEEETSSRWRPAPGCLRQGYWFSLDIVMFVRRLRQASFPGLRGSSGGDSCLCVCDCPK